MLTVKHFRTLAATIAEPEFHKQVGPFALIQRPPKSSEMKPWDVLAGTTRANPDQIQQGVLSLLFEFDELCVATLPLLKGTDQLEVGRFPESDLCIDAPSVSKQHARLKWSAARKRCSVIDLGSTNGTFVDGSAINGETPLHEGDIVSFGDEHFWYLPGQALYRILTSSRAKSLQSRTG
jgi:hypothetical protein